MYLSFLQIALKLGKFDINMFCYMKILCYKMHPEPEAHLEQSQKSSMKKFYPL